MLFALWEILPWAMFFGLAAWLVSRWKEHPRPQQLPWTKQRKSRACPRCGSILLESEAVCGVCQWPRPTASAPESTVVQRALMRLIARFRDLRLISETVYERLDEATASILTTQVVTPAVEDEVERKPIAPRGSVLGSVPASPGAPEAVQPASPERQAKAPPRQPAAAVVADAADRVRRYATRRKTANEAAASAQSSAPPPKREWGKLFNVFLEQNNILWGELVGGLLIVGCSIALVISFWAEIAQRPLLKFGVFNGMSAALFAAGFYTGRRWKIHTTSRGVLVIATLLAPLNFLAIAAFTASAPPTDWLPLVGEGLSLGLFATLTYYAARQLTPHAPGATAASVMTGCLMQLVIRRYAGPDAAAWLIWALAATPTLSFVGAATFSLHQIRRDERLDPHRVVHHLLLLGLCLFATLLPWALLLHESHAASDCLQRLAPLGVAVGAPLLATTLLLWKQIGRLPPMLQVLIGAAGTLGGVALIASVALAWPLPSTLLGSAAGNVLLWFILARYLQQPLIDLLAALFLGICWLIGAAVVAGDITWNLPDASGLIAAVRSAEAGVRLAPLAVLYAAIAGLCHFYRSSGSTLIWSQAAGAALSVSVALLGWYGLGRVGDPLNVTGYFLGYGILLTAVAAALNHRRLSWAATTLLLVALLQATLFRYGEGWGDEAAWPRALLLHSTTMIALAGAASRLVARPTERFCQVAATAALSATVAVAGLLGGVGWQLPYDTLAVQAAWLALAWLALSWYFNNGPLFVAFQSALALAVAVVVTSHLAERPWYRDGLGGWLDPWFWHAQGTAAAAAALLWRVLRLVATRHKDRLPDYVASLSAREMWAVFDRTAALGVALLTIGLAVYGVLPGVAQELSPALDAATRTPQPAASFQLPGVAASHATGSSAWALWGTTVVLIGVGCWDRRPTVHLLALYGLGVAACLPIAAGFAGQTAVASATRWLLGGYSLTAAIVIATRRPLQPWLEKVGLRLDPPPSWLGSHPAQAGRAVVIGSVGSLYLSFGAFVAIATISHASPLPGVDTMVFWSSVVALIAGTVWLAADRLAPGAGWRATSAATVRIARLLLLLLGTGPLAVVSTYVIASTLTRQPLLGPDPASWFGQLGNALLYGGPLVLFAVVLLMFAIRECSSRYAFSFGLLAIVIATLTYLFELAAAGRPLDGTAWIELAQLNGVVAAGIALAWYFGTRRYAAVRNLPPPRPILLQVLAGLAAAFCVEVLLAGCWGIFAQPYNLAWQASVATIPGVFATALAAAAIYFTTRPSGRTLVVGSTLVVVGMLPCFAANFDTGALEAYHTLLIVAAGGSWALTLVPRVWRSITWSQILAGVTAVVALGELMRGLSLGADRWWSIVALLSTSGVLARAAWASGRRAPLWLATPLLVVAGHVASDQIELVRVPLYPFYLLDLTALLLGVAAAVSVRVELSWAHRHAPTPASPRRSIAVHRVAGWLVVALMLLAAAGELLAGSRAGIPFAYGWSPVVALCVSVAATAYCLWDARARWPIAACYTLGVASVVRLVGWLRLEGDDRIWALCAASAAFVLAASYLWRRRHALADWAIQLGAPPRLRAQLDQSLWILSGNCLISIATTFLATYILFGHASFTQRMTAAYAILACALAVAQMAAGRAEQVLRYVALAAGAYFAVAFAWAWIPPTLAAVTLHRLVAAGVAVAAVAPVYGTLLVKIVRRTNPWVAAAQRTIPSLLVVAGGLLSATLATEVWFFVNQRPLTLQWPAVAAVAFALAGLTASALAAAIVPGRDPLALSQRGRSAYVYAAELFTGLLLLHARVSMSWLFSGWFQAYWPAIVMLVAFVGVGLSEWFARRRQTVLSEPLANTGLFLPLLPVVGYWATGDAGQYALLLASVGLLYVVVSVSRTSPLLAGIGLLAFNGSLWTILNSVEGWGLLRHPQFWLIPPVVCLLGGAELNRQRISKEQLHTIRYAGGIMVYAASTADIFINGIGSSVWLPLILAAWSLAGVFAGILFRIRAFLLLGFSFLCVSLFTMVWHAAAQQHRTWIWWVAGMATGLIIIVLFGVFEKKRDEALELVARIRRWDA